MMFKYLGTAAAECWPALFCSCGNCTRAKKAGGRNIRSRSQAVINEDFVIDLPPDTYFHTVNYGLDLTKIRYIIFTHSHKDHFYMPDLHRTYPPYAYNENRENIQKINIYGNASINSHSGESESFEGILDFHEIFAFEKIKIGGYFVTPLPADHDYSQKCFIYIIEEGKSKMLYAHDTGYFLDETWDYLKNNINGKKFDFISLDATNGITEERRGHMGTAAGIDVKNRLCEIGAASEKTVFCFNHFSHNGNKIYDELVPIAKKAGFLVSYDGMEIEI